MNVHFFLDLKGNINEDIYLSGKLTNWRFANFNKMKYNDISGLYMCNLMLKQGLYDFAYVIPNHEDNPNIIEGNHFQTKNEYEIIIYYRDTMLNTDLIIGYIRMI